MTRPKILKAALLLLPTVVAAATVAMVTEQASAVTTRAFVLETAADLAAGELEHVAVRSSGEIVVGPDTVRLALEGVPVVKSIAQSADGQTTYFGTGNDGVIYRLRGDALEPVARTGQLLVTSLALATDGTLYAATIPEGRIYVVPASGEMRELVRLENVESIWALALDRRNGTLYAGTGPDGKIFAIDRAGRASVYFDAPQAHIMALDIGDDGALYAGTDGPALVLRVRGPGRAEAIADLPGNEVTDLAVRGSDLVAIGNEFPAPPSATTSTTKRPRPGGTSSTTIERPRPGKGRLYRVSPEGRVERIFSDDAGHFTDVELAADGTAYVGQGQNGRVYRVARDRTSDTWIDVDERQVLAIALTGARPVIATGDGGAIYRVVPTRAQQGTWNSKVLDAAFSARWGRLVWRGSGRVQVETRSGNTERPDSTWSEWSTALAAPGPIRSPAARYLQIRIRFASDPAAVVRSITAFYLPQNQRAVVTSVEVRAKQAPAPAKIGDARPSSSLYKVAWKVDNPDGDRVRYRLAYRTEGAAAWLPILRETEILTELTYEWNTDGVADGWYRVRVEASDELSNPESFVIRDERESPPVRIDNHDPEIAELSVANGRVRARARDSLGPILRLEVAVDGHDWRLAYPTDDLFDSAEERFDFGIPGWPLPPGPHSIAIRVWDAEGNQAVREATLQIPAPGAAAGRGRGRPR